MYQSVSLGAQGFFLLSEAVLVAVALVGVSLLRDLGPEFQNNSQNNSKTGSWVMQSWSSHPLKFVFYMRFKLRPGMPSCCQGGNTVRDATSCCHAGRGRLPYRVSFYHFCQGLSNVFLSFLRLGDIICKEMRGLQYQIQALLNCMVSLAASILAEVKLQRQILSRDGSKNRKQKQKDQGKSTIWLPKGSWKLGIQ